MLVQRDLTREEPRIWFGWADSSPQVPFDWLLWRYTYVLLRHLWEVVAAACMLVLTTGGVLADRGIDGDVELPEFEEPMHDEKRRSANATLEAHVREHLNVPHRPASSIRNFEQASLRQFLRETKK